jgi:predicted permease
MKLNAALIVCIICSIIAILLLAIVAVQQPFPVFHGSSSNSSMVDTSQNIGAADSRYLWNNDGLALIAQAFVLFAAAAATLGLLKINEEKQHA